MAIKTNAVAGDYDDARPHILLPIPKVTGMTLVKGDLVLVDTSTDPFVFKKHTATALLKGPGGLVVDDPTNPGDLNFSCLLNGFGVCKVEGTATQPFTELQFSDANVNHLEPFVRTNLGATYVEADQEAAQDDRLRIIGIGWGKPGEMGSGTQSKITAATAQLAIVHFGGQWF